MIKHENFPLYRGEYTLERQALVHYVKTYQNHEVSFGMIGRHVVFSEHLFPDDLKIKIQWLISDHQRFQFGDLKNIHSLINLYNDGILGYTLARVVSYSKVERVPKNELLESFVDFVIKPSIRKLKDEEYEKLEYAPKEKTNLSDDDFSELLLHSQNFSKFEEFYQNWRTNPRS